MNAVGSVGATVGYMQNVMAPSSLPSVLPHRNMPLARAECQLGEEWNADAAKIGIVVGVGVAAFTFLAAKAIRAKAKT